MEVWATIKSKKRIILLLLASITVLTLIISFLVKNAHSNDGALYIFAYQTTITGSEMQNMAEKTSQALQTPIQGQTFLNAEAMNQGMQKTDAWAQLFTRLSVSEGDILLLNYEKYDLLLEKGLLLELDGFSSDEGAQIYDGHVFGVDITNRTLPNLTVLDAFAEGSVVNDPKYVKSVEKDGRVIAVIYKNSKNVAAAQTILSFLIGGEK